MPLYIHFRGSRAGEANKRHESPQFPGRMQVLSENVKQVPWTRAHIVIAVCPEVRRSGKADQPSDPPAIEP